MIIWVGWKCAVVRASDAGSDFGSRGLAAPYRAPLSYFFSTCVPASCVVWKWCLVLFQECSESVPIVY